MLSPDGERGLRIDLLTPLVPLLYHQVLQNIKDSTGRTPKMR